MKIPILIMLIFSTFSQGQFFETEQEETYGYNYNQQSQFFSESEPVYQDESPIPDYEEVSPGNPNGPVPIDEGWFILVGFGLIFGCCFYWRLKTSD